jgi:2-(1,2-epoxy-1,2-dihydrophenyl)acetyl-CoA isomerase
MSDELLSQTDGAVYRLVLNRPGRRNALTPDLARALAEEIDQAGDGADYRAIVLSGAGGHFCAGLDLHWLRSLGEHPTLSQLQHGLADFQSTLLAIVRCPLPVLAVVQGTAAGFGFDLALACDLRVAAAGATFTSAFARIGLVPDGGSTFTLPRLIGLGHALHVLMTGETLDGTAARAIGLVDEVAEDGDLDNRVRRLVESITAGAPSSIRTIKRLVRASEVGALEQALSAEGAAQLQALQGAEFLRRLEAFAAR